MRLYGLQSGRAGIPVRGSGSKSAPVFIDQVLKSPAVLTLSAKRLFVDSQDVSFEMDGCRRTAGLSPPVGTKRLGAYEVKRVFFEPDRLD